MTPSRVKKTYFHLREKLQILLGVFRTPNGLVLSNNAIVFLLVQVPCSFYWTKFLELNNVVTLLEIKNEIFRFLH